MTTRFRQLARLLVVALIVSAPAVAGSGETFDAREPRQLKHTPDASLPFFMHTNQDEIGPPGEPPGRGHSFHTNQDRVPGPPPSPETPRRRLIRPGDPNGLELLPMLDQRLHWLDAILVGADSGEPFVGEAIFAPPSAPGGYDGPGVFTVLDPPGAALGADPAGTFVIRAVPAPGVIGLLGLAVLHRRRRRRA